MRDLTLYGCAVAAALILAVGACARRAILEEAERLDAAGCRYQHEHDEVVRDTEGLPAGVRHTVTLRCGDGSTREIVR